jgi:hypothetical protein
MVDGLANSVNKFYPDIPFLKIEIPCRSIPDGRLDLRNYIGHVLNNGLKLLDEYKRVIMMDPDQVMCNYCPDLFGDFDLGCVQNNLGTGPEYGPKRGDVYINAGLQVCTNKEVWKEIMDETARMDNIQWGPFNHQDSVGHVYHTTNHNVKLLEFDDRLYGISGLAHYQDMEIRNGELYLPSNKKLCIFHAAGGYWKTGTKINFDYIKNEYAKALLISYTK